MPMLMKVWKVSLKTLTFLLNKNGAKMIKKSFAAFPIRSKIMCLWCLCFYEFKQNTPSLLIYIDTARELLKNQTRK